MEIEEVIQEMKKEAKELKVELLVDDLKKKRFEALDKEGRSLEKAGEVALQLSRHEKREKLKETAYERLKEKLDIHKVVCKKCKGTGMVGDDSCLVCDGNGVVDSDADMRAIELVLKPEFPNTSVNINANLDKMGVNDLISFLRGFSK